MSVWESDTLNRKTQTEPSTDRRQARRAALAHAKAHGCKCAPGFKLMRTDDGRDAGVIAHEAWCPRLRELRALAGVERLPFPLVTAAIEGRRS
ncbi:hypothetical protein [Solirubrobacter soli]|uniref:hypothetical protein n=1 Tax=Solirubrobacter soli TaxID=363832 RepID=UPI0012FA5C2B|nr:hypothetical protein [Solirubrobacter soli]